MKRRAFIQASLYAGAGLLIGGQVHSASARPELMRAVTYTVRRGDTLSSIATAHGLDHWRPIWEANRGWLADPNVIQIGMELVIPVEGAPQGPPVPPEEEPLPAPVTGGLAEVCGFERSWITDTIIQAAQRYGQSPCQMLGVAWCESRFDPSAYNRSSGASGLYQFLPGTFASTPFAALSIFDAWASANAAGWMWSVGRRGEWVCLFDGQVSA